MTGKSPKKQTQFCWFCFHASNCHLCNNTKSDGEPILEINEQYIILRCVSLSSKLADFMFYIKQTCLLPLKFFRASGHMRVVICHFCLCKHVLSTMGVSKESIIKFLIGNRFHVKLRILSPENCKQSLRVKSWKAEVTAEKNKLKTTIKRRTATNVKRRTVTKKNSNQYV